MQVNSITINATDLTAGRGMMETAGVSGIAGNRLSVPEQDQNGENPFGPAYKVTISREGKVLSKQHLEKQDQNASATDNARVEKMLLRRSEAADNVQNTSDRLRQELTDLEEQISALNSSYNKKSKIENDPVAKDALDELERLRGALKRQKEYEQEQQQKLAKEANIKSGKYQEEIDKNNRDLVTLLKTLEESEKTEEQREGRVTGNTSGGTADNASASVSPFAGGADRLKVSVIGQELTIDDMVAGFNNTANWFLDTANSITKNVMERSADIRTAIDEGTFSDEDITGMVENLKSDMADSLQTVADYRGFGLFLQGELRMEMINHSGDNPMRAVQEAEKAARQEAVDNIFQSARQSVLDDTSAEIADEAEELIERRNDPETVAKEELVAPTEFEFNEPTKISEDQDAETHE